MLAGALNAWPGTNTAAATRSVLRPKALLPYDTTCNSAGHNYYQWSAVGTNLYNNLGIEGAIRPLTLTVGPGLSGVQHSLAWIDARDGEFQHSLQRKASVAVGSCLPVE
jgi:hypothetical protein